MSSPVDPVDLPLVTPAPPARPVARRHRSGDEGRPSPRERGGEQREAPPEGDDDDFPHVDVRV